MFFRALTKLTLQPITPQLVEIDLNPRLKFRIRDWCAEYRLEFQNGRGGTLLIFLPTIQTSSCSHEKILDFQVCKKDTIMLKGLMSEFEFMIPFTI